MRLPGVNRLPGKQPDETTGGCEHGTERYPAGRPPAHRIIWKTKQREIARRMVEKNLDFVLIKEMTGLTEQELNALKKKNQSRNKCNSNHIF